MCSTETHHFIGISAARLTKKHIQDLARTRPWHLLKILRYCIGSHAYARTLYVSQQNMTGRLCERAIMATTACTI